MRKNPAAVSLGRRGGQATAKRGPDYFRKIAAMRKTRAGGRPPKKPRWFQRRESEHNDQTQLG